MASLIKYTAFEPIITGSLLYVLTRGSPDLRARVLRPLASLPFKIEVDTLVKTLKWLFGLGLASRINGWLSRLALDNWSLSEKGKPWGNWQDEIAAVTGGSGGIGSVVVEKLAQKGVRVAIMDLQPPPEKLKAYRNVHFYSCDITAPDSVAKAAAAIKSDLGAPTILFNNAGIGRTYTILDEPDDYLDRIFKINLISHWYTVKAFLPDMIANKKGHIIATASMASFINAAGMVDYCVTKAGVMSFHEGLTQELKHRYNAPFIRTTVVHPYWVSTALLSPWQDQLRSLAAGIMTPDYVGGEVAKAILSGRSQVVCLPPSMASAGMIRAFPRWFQEYARDTTKKFTLEKGS